ncbi:unnamed protein product [Paramecium pentaurelia]|uniref:Uncharacterized protein n=1 Tax=Paramecium pentaurelia TaxID=43138 RepID=A0A8S1VFT5_9CILI|nr:unnamed protein product [Paramecium pentaurelia]
MSIANKMETITFQLYQILASQSEVQLAQNYSQETNRYSTIIVFQRYTSDNKTIFFFAYDSNSLIIIQQQHYKVEEMVKDLYKYFMKVQDFLLQILTKKQETIIHFINYASLNEFDNILIKQEAYKLLEFPFPKSKIIIWMENKETLQFSKDYLEIQISFQQLALLKIERNFIRNQEIYEEFIIKQITQIQEIHQQFKLNLELCESQVRSFNFVSLITDITFIQDVPDQIEYLAQLLMNLSRYTCLDSVLMIAKLKLYRQNALLRRTINQQKLKINEYLQIVQTDLTIFQQEKYCHFPKKGENSQKCKVCQKNNKKVRKSSFVCEACQKHYKINITLCTTKCFKVFHLNPEKYLRRKNRTKQTKVEE